MCREVVAVLKRLKQQRDMSLNEVRGTFRCWCGCRSAVGCILRCQNMTGLGRHWSGLHCARFSVPHNHK